MCVSLCVYPCFYQGSSLCVKVQNCKCSTVSFAFSYTRWRHIFFFNIRARKLVKKSGVWKYNHNSFIYFSRIIPTDFLLFSQRLADRSIWLISDGTSPQLQNLLSCSLGSVWKIIYVAFWSKVDASFRKPKEKVIRISNSFEQLISILHFTRFFSKINFFPAIFGCLQTWNLKNWIMCT